MLSNYRNYAVMAFVQAEVGTQSVEAMQANAQSQAKQAAMAAAAKLADDDAKMTTSEAYKTAVKVINTDLKNAANTSEGIFKVIQQCDSWGHADSVFRRAENDLIAHYRKTDTSIKTMADICALAGVKQLSYSQIKNGLIATVKEADALCENLQKLYDFQYESMTADEQAKNARDTVPEGFLNPWHSRYQKRVPDDEKPVTVFNRDRRLATGSLKALEQAQKLQARARKEADARATERHQEALRQAAASADTAPAGSGGTAQGFSSGTRQGRILSVVVQQALNLLINAVHSAEQYLADSEVLPILGNAHDKLQALIEAERILEREKTAAQSRSHDNPVALGIDDGTEQTDLEDGDMSVLPDMDPADDSDMTETDKANLAAAIEQDLERKAQ